MLKKAKLIVLLIGMALFFVILITIIPNINHKKRTTDTFSSQFTSKEEKIEFLRKYFILNSDILDTEYHILYQDNSGFLPGPSDWDIKAAVKVREEDINFWLEGYIEADTNSVKLRWWDELNLDSIYWSRWSTPYFYKRKDSSSFLVLYRNEGIILKYITTMNLIED